MAGKYTLPFYGHAKTLFMGGQKPRTPGIFGHSGHADFFTFSDILPVFKKGLRRTCRQYPRPSTPCKLTPRSAPLLCVRLTKAPPPFFRGVTFVCFF
jgi:hypothetical protein